MLTIETLLLGGTDKRAVLEHTTMARYLSIGSSWNRIRVMARIAFGSSGSSLFGSPVFALGLLSNPSPSVGNGPLDGFTSHFVGIKTVASNWPFSSPPSKYPLSAGAIIPCKRVGAVDTNVSAGGSGVISGAPATHRFLMGVEIIKGTPNFQVRPFSLWSGPGALVDIPSGVLETGIVMPDTAAASTYFQTATGGMSYSFLAAASVPVDEGTDGILNALVIAWDQTVPVCHVSEVKWAKIE